MRDGGQRAAFRPNRRHYGVRVALLLATTALTSPVFIGSALAQSLPPGGSVAVGTAAIAQSSSTLLTITQSSQSAVVNWQGFSIGQDSTVSIAQPNASSAILNRVTGSTPSTIAGSLTATAKSTSSIPTASPSRRAAPSTPRDLSPPRSAQCFPDRRCRRAHGRPEATIDRVRTAQAGWELTK
jgi:hypothetical protein